MFIRASGGRKKSGKFVSTEGTITVSTNVSGASVKVASGSEIKAEGTATGTVSGAAFTTAKLPNGTYTVTVSKDGYKEVSKEVVVDGDVEKEFELEKIKFEAAQVGRQSIKVTGDDLTDKVEDYTLKKGKSIVSIASVKLADDKKSAVITSASSALSEGDYTVSFNKGIEYPVTVKAESVDKVEIIGNTLVPTSDYDGTSKKDVTVGYRILNQFGEKMLGTITPTSTLGTAKVTKPSKKDEDGVITVTLTSAANLGVTKGSLVLVETTTGKSTSAELVVGTKAAVSKVEILGLYDTSDTNNIKSAEAMTTGDDANKYSLLVKAYDQYGNTLSAIDATDSTKEATITVGGVSELKITGANFNTTEMVNGVEYIKIPFDSVT